MITNENEFIMKMVIDICKTDTIQDAYDLYSMYSPYLKDYKFIFGHDKGGVPGYAVNRNFSAGGVVRSLFNKEHVFVFDAATWDEMASGEATYQVDYSISLDTQALSYLEPYLAGSPNTRIPKDFAEVFEFIAKNNVQIDPTPYISENYSNLDDFDKSEKILGKLKAYETLRTLDTDWFKKNGEVRSTLTTHELTIQAQQRLSEMYFNLEDKRAMELLSSRHQNMYVLLLKMAILQLKKPGDSLNKKLSDFLQFCDTELATISLRETILARTYFERGQNFSFFGKIQKNKDDLKKQLANMAWDLWHVRQMEEMMLFAPSEGVRYFFPALLTFDNRFIEVIDICPLKSFAYKVGSSTPIPFYADDWVDLVPSNKNDITLDVYKYFSEEALLSRNERRNRARGQLPEIVKFLEAELLQLTN